jgi:hypothetical protein
MASRQAVDIVAYPTSHVLGAAELKWVEREANHSPPSSAQIEYSCASALPSRLAA